MRPETEKKPSTLSEVSLANLNPENLDPSDRNDVDGLKKRNDIEYERVPFGDNEEDGTNTVPIPLPDLDSSSERLTNRIVCFMCVGFVSLVAFASSATNLDHFFKKDNGATNNVTTAPRSHGFFALQSNHSNHTMRPANTIPPDLDIDHQDLAMVFLAAAVVAVTIPATIYLGKWLDQRCGNRWRRNSNNETHVEEVTPLVGNGAFQPSAITPPGGFY